jgi:menaquinone-9 beta-reductase
VPGNSSYPVSVTRLDCRLTVASYYPALWIAVGGAAGASSSGEVHNERVVRIRIERPDDSDAVIVGGGPAGAAAATRLAARGFKIILVDRAAFPRDKVCGDFVGPAALVELADLGVTEMEGFRATNKIRDAALHLDGKKLIVRSLPEVDGLPVYGRVIPRLLLDAWVLEAARRAGATVFGDRKVTAVERAPDAVIVRGQSASGPWELRTRLLLGADGSSSTVARALRRGVPPREDRILAVRAYFSGVGGPGDQADLYFSSESFPGYYWLFPARGAEANVGVGMVLSTYPHTSRNLRELLLRLIADDRAMRDRLRGAGMRGRVVGWPLNTYNPRLPLTGDRMMLLGDAAGLINPLNGEGIQYALLSARWAADVAADCLASDQLGAMSLTRYEQRVQLGLRYDMALAVLIVQLIRNRHLNPVWLQALRIITSRARIDPEYGHRVGCVLAGLTPATDALALKVVTGTVEQAIVSAGFSAFLHSLGGPRKAAHFAYDVAKGGIGTAAASIAHPLELVDWAVGVAGGVAELGTQLTLAKMAPDLVDPHQLSAAAHRSRSIM